VLTGWGWLWWRSWYGDVKLVAEMRSGEVTETEAGRIERDEQRRAGRKRGGNSSMRTQRHSSRRRRASGDPWGNTRADRLPWTLPG
jgi:hypothetical protein